MTKDELKEIRKGLLNNASLLFTALIENLNDKLIESYWREFSGMYFAQCLIVNDIYIRCFKKFIIIKMAKEENFL